MKERIRTFRQEMHWTQAAFAARVGVTRDVVASWESGRVEPPETVVRLICHEYAINYDWLKNGREPMHVPQDAVMMDKLEKIMNGDNEFCKSVFRELVDLPADAWDRMAAFVDRLQTPEKQKARTKQ